MENYPRIQHFAYFRGLAYPYVGLTAEVDITLLMQRMERERIPFFLTVCYCAARAANAVPQPADSNPRITWGRYFTREQRTLLPVSLLCHHALVDGIHIAAFYLSLIHISDR